MRIPNEICVLLRTNVASRRTYVRLRVRPADLRLCVLHYFIPFSEYAKAAWAAKRGRYINEVRFSGRDEQRRFYWGCKETQFLYTPFFISSNFKKSSSPVLPFYL